jgi:hypothetical protein
LGGCGGALDGGLAKVGGGGKFGGGTGSRRGGRFGGGGRAGGGRPCSDPHPVVDGGCEPHPDVAGVCEPHPVEAGGPDGCTPHPVADVLHPEVDGCAEPFVAAGCAGGGTGRVSVEDCCDPQPLAAAGSVDGCCALTGTVKL